MEGRGSWTGGGGWRDVAVGLEDGVDDKWRGVVVGLGLMASGGVW